MICFDPNAVRTHTGKIGIYTERGKNCYTNLPSVTDSVGQIDRMFSLL